MIVWAWFTGGGWILVAGGAVVAGLVAAAVVVGATARKRAYARDHARHAWYEPESRPAQDFYGSMDRDEERRWIAGGPVPLPRIPYWPAPEIAHSGWYGQTAADLSPEALALDPGPGDSALVAPGPVYDVGYLSLPAKTQQAIEWALYERDPDPDWLDRQLAGHVAWVARMAPMVTGWSVAA